ncbi:MAG: hypothetical protein CMJ18_19110 [Phycisphaeraceae bacterium]|nr:hypothetical protein [Phycisphaeraceae bacterium]
MPETSHRFTVRYDEALAARMAHRFFMRMFGNKALIAGMLLWAGLIYLMLTSDPRWYLTALTTAAGIVTISFIGVWYVYRRQSIFRVRRHQLTEVVIEIDDEGIACAAATGSSRTNWSAFDRLLKFKDLWLVVSDTKQYVGLPLDQVSADALEMIERRCAACGVR